VEIFSGSTLLNTLNIPNTGSWHNWTTINSTIYLNAGIQTLRFSCKKPGWNFNWYEVSTMTTPVQTQSVINFAPLTEKKVGDPSFDLSATSTNTITPITYTSSNPSVVSVSNVTGTWKATPLAIGTAVITASQAGNSSFLPAADVAQTQVVVAPPPPPVVQTQSVINFPPLTNKTVGDPSFNLVATSNNTVTPITYSSSNPAVVSVSNATGAWKATIVSAGTATITASQEGNANYLPANSVSQAQTVLAAPATSTGTSTSTSTVTGKIPLTAKRWYQLNTLGDGMTLTSGLKQMCD
jgi:uncharacterized protein YjdB